MNQIPYSVNRKNGRKRDVSDVEMREILSDVLPYVRMDHVIPPNNELLNQLIRRGLVSAPPSHMMGGDQHYSRVYAWIRSQMGHFVKPRLFMPYYEEIKVLAFVLLYSCPANLLLPRTAYPFFLLCF